MDLARLATRHLFFTGKGGVGKTSVACATAVKLADMGKRVLLVSTDPASNLDEVLGSALRTTPTPVAGVPGLFALNLDPEAAARSYRDRVVGPYRDLLPPTPRRREHGRAALRCMHGGDRGVRRVREAPGRCLGGRRVRLRPVRHRPDG